MKIYAIIILVSSFFVGCHFDKPNKGESVNSKSDTDCNKGVEAAKQDEAKGKIGQFCWGIAIPGNAKELKSKYGIEFYSKGCVNNESDLKMWNCYNEYMKGVIRKKFNGEVKI